MSKKIEPYLFFNGRCEEALEFYRTAVGAKVQFLMRYKESPEQQPGRVPPNWGEKIMHTTFLIGETPLMASDGCETTPNFQGFSLSISVASEAEAKTAFDALAVGGKVGVPLTKTFWSPCFGMLTDRFGLGWMISVPGHTP